MNRRAVTAPGHGRSQVEPGRGRLAAWLLLVGLLIVLAYVERGVAGKPDPQILYKWSTAVGALLQDGILVVLVLVIGGYTGGLFALRRPPSIGRAAAMVVGVLVAIFVFEAAYGAAVHPGNEQGLTPKHWESAHAAAYVVNAIVICTWVPLVEELTYRGLGYTLVERFGRAPAILIVGLLFGLAHGLLLTLPIIVAFGCLLAWLRSRTGSIFPGLAAHAVFNLIALVAAVTVGS